MNVQLQKGIA